MPRIIVCSVNYDMCVAYLQPMNNVVVRPLPHCFPPLWKGRGTTWGWGGRHVQVMYYYAWVQRVGMAHVQASHILLIKESKLRKNYQLHVTSHIIITLRVKETPCIFKTMHLAIETKTQIIVIVPM